MAATDVTTAQRSDGTWSATVNSDTCTHRHATAKSADACGAWEANAIAKGTSRWHRDPDAAPARRARKAKGLDFTKIKLGGAAASDDEELASDDEAASSHEYVASQELLALWHAMVQGAQKRPAGNMLWVGPSGSGKTDGARHLAALVDLPFTKVDAASMTDPEAWFGTREIVVQDGLAVTNYQPSEFIESIQKPGVTLVDEITRVRDEHRNVLIPLLDHTRAVLNPLTGQIVNRHPMNFIIMAGNVGINFTGTSAVDPAFWSRARKVEFDYLNEADERRVVQDASACSAEDAYVLVRFANETREKARTSADEFAPVSTRELIEAGRDIADGLPRDLSVKFNILLGASDEGAPASVRGELTTLWGSVRVAKLPQSDPQADPTGSQWLCPKHHQAKVVPAGTSSRTGLPYSAFRACPVMGCDATEDRSTQAGATGANGSRTCADCGASQPSGRNTFCTSCGATL